MGDEKQRHRGDRVEWSTHGTTTEGEVVEELTETAGRTVRASSDDPQCRDRSDTSGRDGAHRPSAPDRT